MRSVILQKNRGMLEVKVNKGSNVSKDEFQGHFNKNNVLYVRSEKLTDMRSAITRFWAEKRGEADMRSVILQKACENAGGFKANKGSNVRKDELQGHFNKNNVPYVLLKKISDIKSAITRFWAETRGETDMRSAILQKTRGKGNGFRLDGEIPLI